MSPFDFAHDEPEEIAPADDELARWSTGLAAERLRLKRVVQDQRLREITSRPDPLVDLTGALLRLSARWGPREES